MIGSAALLAALNTLLADEQAAIVQYAAHLSMATNWQYSKLAAYIAEHIDDERKHATMLRERIAFLEGEIVAGELGNVAVGADVPEQLANDAGGETLAIQRYNAAIKLSLDNGDNTTRDILSANLSDENDHLRDIEARQNQIVAMGLDNFLSAQV